MADEQALPKKCEQFLQERWNHILAQMDRDSLVEPLGKRHQLLRQNIRHCLASKTKSYRYVLPTQLLCKAVDHSLDCRSLQASYESEGSFDARTVAHKVIVPFEKRNHKVLGGSNEPYVNNPLRCKSVSIANRARQKNKRDWDRLIYVLDFVENENDLEFTREVLDQVLLEIYRYLSDVVVVYPTPNRISLEKTIHLLNTFIAEPSGGDRLEAVTAALFRTISRRFSLFDEIKREKVNAPDSASGLLADIECWLNEKIILLVEVKDRSLNLTQLDTKVDLARAEQIKEILFIAQEGIEPRSSEEVNKKVTQEFSSGQNIYISDLVEFAKGILILLGEHARVDFIGRVGAELDMANSSIEHRKVWATLLKEI